MILILLDAIVAARGLRASGAGCIFPANCLGFACIGVERIPEGTPALVANFVGIRASGPSHSGTVIRSANRKDQPGSNRMDTVENFESGLSRLT